MNRGDSLIHISFLHELRRLQAKLPVHTNSDLGYVRALAFGFKCRDDNYAVMLNHLIEKVVPLAIKERLTA